MAYKKRDRNDKYEKKLRIDGTFEEAMQALLGVHPKQQNMKKIAEPKEFTFEGLRTTDQKLTNEEMIALALKKYCIKIDKIKPSELIVNATPIILDNNQDQLRKLKALIIECFPVELNKKNEIIMPPVNVAIKGGSWFYSIDPKGAFDFSGVKYGFNFECNALLFYSRPIDYDAIVLFSCFKQ